MGLLFGTFKKILKGGADMLVQSKVQIDNKDLEFIKKTYKTLSYKSLSDYMRAAITSKIKEDRKKIREIRRKEAFEMLGKSGHQNLFSSIEGEDFEDR
jgi:Arc/MetJ-type ribon-helix-helix transcriptional regulator